MRRSLPPALVNPLAATLIVLPLVASGCGPDRLSVGETEGADDGAKGDGGGGGRGVSETRTLELNRDVDILVVIDNSGSMAGAQAKLARDLPVLIDELEDGGAGVNYRIGMTTTDNGNVECSGTSPEGGNLRLVSCTERQDEFIWPKVNPQVDAYEEACTSRCPEEVGGSLRVSPTLISEGSEPRPRPWIERYEGVSNIQGSDVAQALRCYGPQGVDGCGFEAQLESQFKALQRAFADTEPQFGFVREKALLAVIHVTDEADCSANEVQQARVFSRTLPENERVFWSDPSSPVPTSAICWNAGVKCAGSGGVYTRCDPQDYDAYGGEIGSATIAANEAVMRPLSRYIAQLQAIEDGKKTFHREQEVIVSVLAGVPIGYEGGQIDVAYQDAVDPDVQANFGVGWACETGDAESLFQGAVPIVRLRELAGAFDSNTDGTRNVYSICESSFAPALRATARTVRDRLRAGCFRACVEDIDVSTPQVLDVDCTVEEQDGATGRRSAVPPCIDGELPAGEEVCYLTRSGDERSTECVEGGWNLEFDLVRDPSNLPSPATSFTATCQLSDFPELDCPEL